MNPEDRREYPGHMMSAVVGFTWNQMEVLEGGPHAAGPLSALTRGDAGRYKK